MAFSPRVITKDWIVDASPSLVWEILAHTDKLNRAVGLPPVHPAPLPHQPLAQRVDARLFGLIPMQWMEWPFEWVRERRYRVQRDYLTGPLKRFRGGVDVESNGAGCCVRFHAEITPRNLLGALAVPMVGRSTINKTIAYCRRALRERETERAPEARPPAARRSNQDSQLLQLRGDQLRAVSGLSSTVVKRLIHHLATGADPDVTGMQPYALAVRWGTKRPETLRVFLHATKSALLTLSWEMLCPVCRVSKEETDTLALVSNQIHCETCGLSYQSNLDRSVELRFRIHPGIRSAHRQVFCFGGPYHTPHILVQHLLQPGETRDAVVPLASEEYQIRTWQTPHVVNLQTATFAQPTVKDQSDPVSLVYTDQGWDRMDATFRPGPIPLQWTNRTAHPVMVLLEQVRWDEHAVTAAEVTSMQEFRDLFASEVLAAGQEIGVESITILFSDLKDSTKLYEERGDALAYGHVRQHFDFLKRHIAARRGALVKTVGDAIMAVFYRPEDALECSLDIQREFPAFVSTLSGKPPLVIKLGLHTGPAITIQANSRLDYFGRTVNLAARLLRESRGGDVVVAKSFLDDPRVRMALSRTRATVQEEWTTTVRGVAQPLALCRLVG